MTIIFAILFPTKWLAFYLAGVTAIILAEARRFIKFDSVFLGILTFVCLLMLFHFVRGLFELNTSSRDILEYFRYTPLLALVLTRQYWIEFDEKKIFRIFSLILCCFLLSLLLQFLDLALGETPLRRITKLLSQLYTSERNYEVSYLRNRRFFIFSNGPGPQGVIGLFFACYFYSVVVGRQFNQGRFFLALLLLGASLCVVVFSQSQTAFLGLVLLMMMHFLIFQKLKVSLLKIGITITVLGGALLAINQYVRLPYLSTLFKFGLNRSSFLKRTEKWEEIIDFISHNPVKLLFGHGKDAFGFVSRAMDSEFLYFASVYGMLFFCLFYFLLIFIWFRAFASKSWRHVFFVQIVPISLLTGIASSFYLDPRVSTLFVVLVLPLLASAKPGNDMQGAV